MRIYFRIPALFSCAALVAGCNTTKDYSGSSYLLHGDYSRLSSCAYARLSDESGIGLTHTEFTASKTAEIKSQSGAVISYDAKFIDEGGMTRLIVRAVPTIYGADFWPAKVRDAALSCGAA